MTIKEQYYRCKVKVCIQLLEATTHEVERMYKAAHMADAPLPRSWVAWASCSDDFLRELREIGDHLDRRDLTNA